jgi:iron complex outermembrane receptor protein
VLLAPSVEAVINDKTRLLLQFLYQKDSYDTNLSVPTYIVGDKIEVPEQFSSQTELYGTIGDKSTKELSSTALTINHELSGDWIATLKLQADKKKRKYIAGNFAYQYYGYIYTAHDKDNANGDDWAGELRLQGHFDAFNREHQVTAGVEINERKWERVSGFSYEYIATLEDYTGNIADYPYVSASEISDGSPLKYRTKNKAFYAQVLLSLTDNTKLLMGSRYDIADDSLEYWVTESRKQKNNALTSRVALIHTVNDNINAYAAYSESFVPTISLDSSYNILDPETGEGYEAGLKTEWFDKNLGVNVAVYRQDLNNRPIDDPSDSTGTFSVSSGLHRTDGVELEINGSPYLGWTISAAAAWMDNEFIEEGDDYYGLSIGPSVDQQFSLHTNYEIQQGGFKGLSLGATFISVGDRNHINPDWASDSGKSEQVYLDGYNRLDVNFSYNVTSNWDVNLLVRNVTDEKYLDTGDLYGVYYGAPRSVLLEATYNFD